MATVHLQAISYLSRILGSASESRFTTLREVDDGVTVRRLFDHLASESPDFAKYVFDRERQELTGYVSVIYNNRALDLVGGLDTEVQDGDTIFLLPAYAGGQRRSSATTGQLPHGQSPVCISPKGTRTLLASAVKKE